jgi:transcriptional regulator with XRE-family HTH domain
MFSKGNVITHRPSQRSHKNAINRGMAKLKIQRILKRRGWTQTKLAEAVDVTRGYMSMLVSGKKVPSLEILERIADALDVDIGALYGPRETPVAGRVGAGASVELVDAYPRGDGLYHVACPDDLPARDVVAVEVTGDSMLPLIRPGDILFFSRFFMGVDGDTLNRVGICATEDGRALVKLIRPGRDKGTFDLYSANDSAAAPIYGVRLKWAAPLRRHIASEDVESVEK